MSKANYTTVTEFFSLLWLNAKTQTKAFFDLLTTARNYYSNKTFRKIDLCMMLTYLLQNPFTISRKFLTKKGEKEVYAYGETPLTTLDQIAKECRITKNDTVFELGCGRGRSCFWLNSFIKCKVVGIDFIPDFIQRAQAIKKKCALTNVEFRLQDMLQADLTGATVIYLYGTCLNDATINQLIVKFEKLPKGTKVITVSYPLTDYKTSQYEVMKCFLAPFPWGEADVYLHIKTQ